MRTWRVARSLDVLLDQLNAAAPGRSKVADGSIGDAAHSARTSDHNPDDFNVVRARDYTHDPQHGADMNVIAESLRQSRDPRIKYVIWAGRLFDTRPQFSPWQWQPYHGANSHHHHMHVSVVGGSVAEQTTPWVLGRPNWTAARVTAFTTTADVATYQQQEEDSMAALTRDDLTEAFTKALESERGQAALARAYSYGTLLALRHPEVRARQEAVERSDEPTT